MVAERIQGYAITHNSCPGPRSTFTAIEDLEGELGASALFPAHDPWGRPYWYWTNGEHFILGSGGPEAADDRWASELERNPRGAKAAVEALCGLPGSGAVLVADGRFVVF